MKPHFQWIDAGQITRWRSLDADIPTRALVVDLDDPVLAQPLRLAPTRWDFADERGQLAGPKKYFLKRRALLRALVALRAGCSPGAVVIAHDAQGAPRVVAPDPSVFVSVSARGSYAGLAISDAPVGIDIEPCRPREEPVWNVLHPAERAEVEAQWRGSGDDSRFREIWIGKEAYLKALGTGFKREPASIAVRFNRADAFEIRDDLRPNAVFPGLLGIKTLGNHRVECACVALDGRSINALRD